MKISQNDESYTLDGEDIRISCTLAYRLRQKGIISDREYVGLDDNGDLLIFTKYLKEHETY
jgi:hypothetical protein